MHLQYKLLSSYYYCRLNSFPTCPAVISTVSQSQAFSPIRSSSSIHPFQRLLMCAFHVQPPHPCTCGTEDNFRVCELEGQGGLFSAGGSKMKLPHCWRRDFERFFLFLEVNSKGIFKSSSEKCTVGCSVRLGLLALPTPSSCQAKGHLH